MEFHFYGLAPAHTGVLQGKCFDCTSAKEEVLDDNATSAVDSEN